MLSCCKLSVVKLWYTCTVYMENPVGLKMIVYIKFCFGIVVGETSWGLPWCVPADCGLSLQELPTFSHLQYHRSLLLGGHYVWAGQQAGCQTEQDEVNAHSVHSIKSTIQQLPSRERESVIETERQRRGSLPSVCLSFKDFSFCVFIYWFYLTSSSMYT